MPVTKQRLISAIEKRERVVKEFENDGMEWTWAYDELVDLLYKLQDALDGESWDELNEEDL